MRLPQALSCCVLAALLAAAQAPAQDHPNVAKGFHPAGTFAVGDLDNINSFNGNLILTLPLGQKYPVGGGLSYGLTLVYNSQVWELQEYGGLLQSIPLRTNNAGLGWMVSLGRFKPLESDPDALSRDTYMSPDGAQHALYPTLHEGDTPSSGVQYSRDGSYLRYTAASRTMELPDGTLQIFDADGYPIQIRSRFNQQINITYRSDAGSIVPAPQATQWHLADSQGRTQKVFFRTLAGTSFQSRVVDRVEVTAFGGGTATYTFQYNLDDGQPLAVKGCGNLHPDTQSIAVALLTRLRLPDGTSYSMPVSDYFGNVNTPGIPCKSGMIRGMTLPTLGRIEWDYITYSFPGESTKRQAWQRPSGVGSRTLRDANGAVLGTWTYASALTPVGVGASPTELVNSVTDPLGNRRTSYFSVCAVSCSPLERLYEYGLPLSRDRTGDGTGRFLSTETADSSSAVLRKTYVRYEHDQPATTVGTTLQDWSRLNQRVAAERTLYQDDSGTFADETFSDFDGVGHYRTRQTGGNFPGSNVRTSHTFYNPGNGTYGQGSFSMWPAGAPWVLDTYPYDWTAEAGSTAFRSYCWDAATGAMLRKRVHQANGAAQGNADIVQVFGYSSGNLTGESWYGGDTQTVNLSGADFCAMALPASPVYQLAHSYASGARASTQYVGPGIKSLDLTIDGNTGLPSQSRDTAGLQTTYSYDAMGRLLSADPSGDATTTYTYRLATSAASLARVTVARVGTAGTLAESRIDFDGLGRPVKEEQRMPDGSWSGRQTAYNALGWKTLVTEQGSVYGTSFLSYDPFGRPRTLRPADGGGHDVTLSYSGVRQIARTLKVGTTSTAETNATTTEVYDRFGRLYEITEPNNIKTRYDYDMADRLVKVCQNASGAACGQTRLFTYDNRGFLIQEQHPEKPGAEINSYDALGHPARQVDGPLDLTFVYDKAERLTLVRESGAGFVDCANNSGHRCLKTFTYANANGTVGAATDYKKGKLVSASRLNFVGSPFNATVEVKETYQYTGREGRTSLKDTAMIFNGAPLESFRQTFTWDELGNLANQIYPDCTASTLCGASAPRSVGSAYINGFLTAVPGYASGISYHANGLVFQVTRANGVVDTQDNDLNGMARPRGLSAAKNGVTLWSAGNPFQYDGSGNIWKQGNHTYTYDSLSRLATATLYDSPTGGGTVHPQSYTYDLYGNLQSLTADGVLLNTPTASATNRLTNGTYDVLGNLKAWNGNAYEYDAFNQMTRMVSGAEDWRYIYTADDERFWLYRVGGGGSLWTLRDLDNRVLREYQAHTSWGSFKDYIYRDSVLLAEADSPALGGAVRHFHTDHLGTVRAITDGSGQRLAYHLYAPYGQEITPFNQDAERMKFTGHERDLASPAGTGDDLDYMHARHESPVLGRFLSMDSANGEPKDPRTWNRYAYTLDNPIKYVDPNGLAHACPPEGCHEPKTFWEKLEKGFELASILPGPMAIEAPATRFFKLVPVERGFQIEAYRAAEAGGALPKNFPVIDRFLKGIATSVKSMDLRAATYQNTAKLESKLAGYINKLASFNGKNFAGFNIAANEIKKRVLELVFQKGAATLDQAAAIQRAVEYARSLGIQVKIILVH
jgi:RHS repeat-associated protein